MVFHPEISDDKILWNNRGDFLNTDEVARLTNYPYVKSDNSNERYFDRQGKLKNDILVISGTAASLEAMKVK